MSFLLFIYLVVVFPLKILCAFIILIILSVKKKYKKNKAVSILLKIVSVLMALIIMSVGVFVVYMRTVIRWLPENNEVYAPAGMADKHIYKSAYDGKNETWLYKLNGNENEEALLNVSKNDAWNKLSEEDYESICSSCFDEYSCDVLIAKKGARFDIHYSYFAVYDFESGKYMCSEEFRNYEYINGNFLILIFDPSIQYYYALRTS